MPPRASVVVPNWNGERFLAPCFCSLREQTFRNFETILVDSGSKDGSVAFTQKNFPEVRTVALGENRGFAAAANAGILASSSEYVALLNNDTEQDPRWLRDLVTAADSHPEAGSFACKMLNFHDRETLDGAGDTFRPDGLPYRLGHGERDRGQFDRPAYVFGACGGAALYRRSLFEEVGLFDEDFESYCEDADLAFRAQAAGSRCLYVPTSVVYHVGGGSTGGKRSPTATRLGTRNSLNLLAKNLPLPLVPHLLPFFLLGQTTRLAATAASGVLPDHLQGIAEAGRMFPRMLRKRRVLQRERKLSDAEVRHLLRRGAASATASIFRRLRDRTFGRFGA